MSSKQESERETTGRTRREDFRRVSAALVESEGRFRRMADATLDVIWITDLEPEKVVYVSPSFERIWGLKAQDLYDDPHLWIQGIHPEDRDRVGSAFVEWISRQPDQPWESEYRILRPDGEVRWIIEHGVVISEIGGPKRVSGISKDVTDRRRVEAALRESEQRFALAVAGSADGIWDWDIVSGQMFISERGQRLYGLEPGIELRPRSEWLRMVDMPSEDVADRRQAIADYVAGRVPGFDSEWRVRHPDGVDRWVRLRGLCVRDAEGRATRFSGSITDIDVRKRTEQALAQSEQRHALAMQAARDGFWDWTIADDDFHASPRTLDICGFAPAAAFSGREDFWARMPIHPDDAQKWREAARLLLLSEPRRFDIEFRLLLDGEIRWIDLTGLATSDAAGRAIRWTGSVSDISGRKTSEAARRESEERFALAVVGSNDGLWDWDIETDQMFISDRAQRIYSLQAGATQRPRQEWRALVRLHPDDAADQSECIAGYLEGERPAYDGEWRVQHPDGGYRWVRIRGVCLRDAEGRPTRMAGSVSDIDSHRRAQAALQQTQRLEAVGTLAGGIAHDFNNILGAILGFGEMALASSRANTRLRRDVESIITAGERGRALVQRILAFSRSGVGKRVPVRVEGVLREAIDLLSGDLPVGVRVETQLCASRAIASCDPTQVQQVLINLATNAIHAMPGGGILRIELHRVQLAERFAATTGDVEAGAYVALSVTDNGSGIGAEARARIFDPFFTTKAPGAGTGLGLSLVHGIVTELGGAIDVTTALDRGSSFRVFLPCSDADVPTDASAVASVPAPRGAHQQVLVVDDEQALVRLTTERLGELGYVCVAYTSSADALVAFQAHPERFDAIVTDERMPGLSGISLIEAVHALRPELPALLVSGYLQEELLVRARAAGATAVLGKPLGAGELAIALASALAQAPGSAAAPTGAATRAARGSRRAAGTRRASSSQSPG